MSLFLTAFNLGNMCIPFRGFFRARRIWLRWTGLTIGKNVRIATGAKFYDTYISIGAGSWIGPETTVYSNVAGPIRIEEDVDIAPGCLLVAGSHVIGDAQRRAGRGIGAPIVIGKGTWIGARCVVLGGARIGRGCVVGAGSVVLAGSYPDSSLIVGNPAKVKRVIADAS